MDKETKIALRLVNEEIHFRNLVAKYIEINRQTRRIASAPCVGIFWVDTKKANVYSDKSKIRDADEYGGFKIHKRCHYEAWGHIQQENPQWKGVQYEDIPRGRVTFDIKQSKFIVTMCPMLNKPKFKDAVVEEFDLPHGHYEFDFDDEHYELQDFGFMENEEEKPQSNRRRKDKAAGN